MNQLNYDQWVAENFPTPDSAKLHCSQATQEMSSAFPELRRVRGHALVNLQWRPHWWCVTPDNVVVDPTAHQWDKPPIEYDALPEDAEEPHGKCINCGELLYRSQGAGSHFCGDCKP